MGGSGFFPSLMLWGGLAGCYSPNAATGVPCPDNICPAGQVCDVTQVCVTSIVDASGPVDGDAVADAPVTSCLAGCPIEEPVCDIASGTCRGCIADSECPSDACVEWEGRCAAEAEVVYVAPNASNPDCTRLLPCKLGNAQNRVAAGRAIVRLAPGSYSEQLHFNNNNAFIVTFSGPSRDPANASITSGNGATVAIDSAAIIEGFTITAPSGDAVRNNGPLVAYRVYVTSASQAGFQVQADLRLLDSTIAKSGLNGIFSSRAGLSLEIVRTSIIENTGGGISLTAAATVDITSTVLAKNGSASSTNGALHLTTPDQNSRFSFLTIADNLVAPGNDVVETTGPILIDNSIFAGNESDLDPAVTATTYCMFESTSVPSGLGNRNGSPSFVSGYHISNQSNARSMANGSNLPDDIDGDHRPKGMGPDIGADEIP